MGVSGAGKTTVGDLLAKRLGWRFCDADDFHPPGNREKMRNGVSLNDADRLPWLASIRRQLDILAGRQERAVLACSALKQSYRAFLRQDDPAIVFVYLQGNALLIRQRLAGRIGHFIAPGLLASQFAELEEPLDALAVDISLGPAEIVKEVVCGFGL
ncbi:MAG: gluconate kinase [Deltaproteobacteria bacterium RIFOXYD12_FULL_57_12]|nr:MAG: gluconate kinase [Deltaproteobacteria bacterium RIFOXYD12_FULL_57_12]